MLTAIVLLLASLCGAAGAAEAPPTVIAVSWDALPLPPDGGRGRDSLRSVYSSLGIERDLRRYSSLTDPKERAKQISATAEKLARAAAAVQRVEQAIPLLGGRVPTSRGPAPTTKEIEGGLVQLARLTENAESAFSQGLGTPVRITYVENHQMEKALKDGAATLALVPGATAAWARLDEKGLLPLAIGVRNDRDTQGLGASLVLSAESPALKALAGYPDFDLAKWRALSPEARLAFNRDLRRRLVEGGDVRAFTRLGVADAELEALERKTASPLHAEALRQSREQAVAELTEQGLRKLMQALRCERLTQPDLTRSHVALELGRLISEFGPAGGRPQFRAPTLKNYRSDPQLPNDGSIWLAPWSSGPDGARISAAQRRLQAAPEDRNLVGVLDHHRLAREQRMAPNGWFGQVFIAQPPGGSRVTPPIALWHDPRKVPAGARDRLRSTLARLPELGSPDFGLSPSAVLNVAFGASELRAPTDGRYEAQLAEFRKTTPATRPLSGFVSSDCEPRAAAVPRTEKPAGH